MSADPAAALAALATDKPPVTVVDRIAHAIGGAFAWAFLIAIGITVYEVAARYLFNAPTSWAHATATTLCAVAFALGGAYALARDEHVRIAALFDRLPPRGRFGVEAVGLALGLFYLGGLALGSWDQTVEAVWRFDAAGAWRPELTPGPPNWPLPSITRVALTFGAELFLLGALARLVALLRGRWTP